MVGFQDYPAASTAIYKWFQDRGWPVTATHHDFERDVFAWRHEAPGFDRTLRVTRRVLEDIPADLIGATLDGLRVADHLERRPEAYTVIVSENGSVVIRQLDAPP
jgi:hypothetical protein